LKNEAPYLAEFVAYHLRVVVDHFWLLDNDSDDHPTEVLRPCTSIRVS
jgi:hypothetical protein